MVFKNEPSGKLKSNNTECDVVYDLIITNC